MSGTTVTFSRVIVTLGRDAADRDLLSYATQFAKLLQLEILGLFAQDPSLHRLGEFPSLREFRPLEGQWRGIAGSSILRDLDLAVAVARRAVEQAGRSAGVTGRFEIVRARRPEAIAAISGARDIVLAAQPLTDIAAAALGTEAAVLIVPRQAIRRHGAILAIADSDDDPSLAAARAIAAAVGERVEVVAPSRLALPLPYGLPHGLGERLIVITRRPDDGADATALAKQRRIPVLVLPPRLAEMPMPLDAETAGP